MKNTSTCFEICHRRVRRSALAPARSQTRGLINRSRRASTTKGLEVSLTVGALISTFPLEGEIPPQEGLFSQGWVARIVFVDDRPTARSPSSKAF